MPGNAKPPLMPLWCDGYLVHVGKFDPRQLRSEPLSRVYWHNSIPQTTPNATCKSRIWTPHSQNAMCSTGTMASKSNHIKAPCTLMRPRLLQSTSRKQLTTFYFLPRRRHMNPTPSNVLCLGGDAPIRISSMPGDIAGDFCYSTPTTRLRLDSQSNGAGGNAPDQ